MIVLATALIGCALGAWKAQKGGGNRLDIAQYAVVYAIVFALLGLFFTIGIERLT
ncbi:MAG: hypothetical protein AAGF71_05875 [Pseudomonadota bacterium]